MRRSISLLSVYLTVCASVPVRIASNGIDSVVLSPEGGQETVLIDTNSNFRVERLDSPIERIEIRLINENSSAPLVIGIQKGHPTENRDTTIENSDPDATTAPSTTSTGGSLGEAVVVLAKAENGGSNGQKNDDVVTETSTDNVEPAVHAEPTSPASETVIIIRTGGAGDTVAIDPTSATTTSTTSASFADNGGFGLDDALTHEDPSDTGNHLEAAQDTTYIDDLPLDDVVDEEEQTDEESAIPVEECLANKDKLPMDTVQRMLRQRTRLSQLIRLVNRRQNMFCRPDHQKDEVEYRKCPMWRQEKMVHYYKIMRLTYCSDYSKWPDAPRVKRTFGQDFPLFEKLYAFTQKQ